MYQCVCIAIMKLQMNNGYLHKSEYLYSKELVSSTLPIIDGSSRRIYHSKLDHPTGHTHTHIILRERGLQIIDFAQF